jgi:hypothetical protein
MFSTSKIGKNKKSLKSKDWIGCISLDDESPLEHKKT